MSGARGIATFLAFAAALGAATWLVARLASAGPSRDGASDRPSVMLGTVRGSRRDACELGLDELQHGVLVGGSPGAGKTTLLVAVASRIPEPVGLVYVDLKGDRSLATRLAIAPERVFGLGERSSAAWSPLSRGSPASWRDILMAAQEWSEPHYRQAAARYLGALLGALGERRRGVELGEVIELLERPKAASGELRGTGGAARTRLERAVAALASEPSLRSGVAGLGNRLALLCDSPATNGRFGGSGGIDLLGVFAGERVLFSLPAAEYPDEAPAIAACVIQSLGAIGQGLASGDQPLRTLLVVDEAPRLAGNQLREAVAIGRGAGIGSVIAVQDFADLDYVALGTREAVETGANTWVVMRQVASAEAVADALGSTTTRKETIQHDSRRLAWIRHRA